MVGFEALIAIMVLVVFCSALAEHINIPYPIVLIILGLVIGYIPNIPQWSLPRESLIPLFLPPILFRAALTTSWEEFRNNAATIISLGILLVLATSFLVAGIVNAYFPTFGFMTALLLGAIISPSDAVCATAIFSRLNLSPQITGILESESLINDVAGILLYSYALSAVLYHESTFTFPGIHFFMLAIGGILIGLIVGLLCSYLMNMMMKRHEASLLLILSLIIPYLSYDLADKLGVSGILAVVAAGVTSRALLGSRMDARSRLVSKPVWDTVVFALNGVVFVLLGLQIPKTLQISSAHFLTMDVIKLAGIVITTLIIIRIVWVYLSAWILNTVFKRYEWNAISDYKENLLIGWSGMRGIVSLALALATPGLLYNGATFPRRNIIILITALTIVATVVFQGLILPLLVKVLNLKKDIAQHKRILSATINVLTKKTIKKVEQTDFDDSSHQQNVKEYLLSYYQNRLQYNRLKKFWHENVNDNEDPDLMIINYYQYERKQLYKMYKSGKIDIDIFSRMIRYLDIEESRIA